MAVSRRFFLKSGGIAVMGVGSGLFSVPSFLARAAGSFQPVKHPTAGDFETVAPPIRMSLSNLRSDKAGPHLGAHTRDVLSEAGLSAADIDAIVARKS